MRRNQNMLAHKRQTFVAQRDRFPAGCIWAVTTHSVVLSFVGPYCQLDANFIPFMEGRESVVFPIHVIVDIKSETR